MEIRFVIQLIRTGGSGGATELPAVEQIPVAYETLDDAMEDGRKLLRERKLRAHRFRIVDEDGKLVCKCVPPAK